MNQQENSYNAQQIYQRNLRNAMLRLQYNPTIHQWIVSEDPRIGLDDEDTLDVVEENLELLDGESSSPERNYSGSLST